MYYLDSEYSIYIIGDHVSFSKLISQNKRYIIFRDNNKEKNSGIKNISNKSSLLITNIFLVDDLKYNLIKITNFMIKDIKLNLNYHR